MTAKVRGGASYREELRREVRDGFLQLLGHFNALIAHANALLKHQSRGPLLFIMDGTDKLSKDDANALFQADVNQLGQIMTNRAAAITVIPFKGENYFTVRTALSNALNRVDVDGTHDAETSWQMFVDEVNSL